LGCDMEADDVGKVEVGRVDCGCVGRVEVFVECLTL